MHNLKDIRKNTELFEKKIKDRNSTVDLKSLIKHDTENRELIQKKEKLEQEKKILSKKKDPKNYSKSKSLSNQIEKLENSQKKIQDKINAIVSSIPNLALDDVPVGKDEKSNKIIKKSFEVKKFDFQIKSHTELSKNFMDFESATKLSGSRFVVLKDKLALLERALLNFMIDVHTKKFGYIEVSPPLLVNEKTMYGTGQLPKFEKDQYEIVTEKDEERKFLIPTAEVPLSNLFSNSVIDQNKLPLRYVAGTPCFRREAGSYGKDTKGIMRQHQFYKVELVSLVEPSKCNDELSRMLNCAEEILKMLELPYQIVLLSSGDMGFSAQKTFDIETWIPFENKFREISSCSSCGVFQARRMKTKYKSGNTSDFIGTLNGSGLATGRLMIALMEYYQNSDGSITIPTPLKRYMNNIEKI
jgi:seryl-tRNA synthetase